MRALILVGSIGAVMVLCGLASLGSDPPEPLVLEGGEELVIEGGELCVRDEIVLDDGARFVMRNATLRVESSNLDRDWINLRLHANSSAELSNVMVEGDVEGFWMAAYGSSSLYVSDVTAQHRNGFSVEACEDSQVTVTSCDVTELRVRDRATLTAEDVRVGWTVDLGLWGQPVFTLTGLVREMEIDQFVLDAGHGFPWRLELRHTWVNGWSVHVGTDTEAHLTDSVIERIVLILDGASGELAGLRPQLYEDWTFPDDAGLATDTRLILENTEMSDHWGIDISGNAQLHIRDCDAMYLNFTRGYIDAEIADTGLYGLSFRDVMGDVLFEDVTVRDELVVADTVWLSLAGSLAFGSEAVIREWSNSMVQRTFAVDMARKDGSPAVGQQAALGMPDGRMKTLTANSDGRIELTAIFDDETHERLLPLRIDPGDRLIERTIGMLSDSPLKVDFLRASVDSATLYVGTNKALGSLYPPGSRLMGHVYETLFTLDSRSRPVPLLAASVPTVGNGKISGEEAGAWSIRIAIREGVSFHSGQPLELEDIEYSLELGLIGSGSPWTPDALEAIGISNLDELISEAGLEVATQRIHDAVRIEDGSIVFALDRSYSGIWAFLAGAPIAPRDWMIARGMWDGTPAGLGTFRSADPGQAFTATDANGTGPFALASISPDGRDVTLLANPRYWGETLQLERVVVYYDRSPAELIELLAAEAIDVVADMPPDLLQSGRLVESELRDIRTLKPVAPRAEPGILFALFNQVIVPSSTFDLLSAGEFSETSMPVDLFSDLDARLGFLHGFDWDGFGGEARETGRMYASIGTPVAPFLFEPLRSGVAYDYDPAVALAHFSAAWDGRLSETGFTVHACFNGGNDARRQFSEALDAAMSALDPRFHIAVYDPDFNTVVNNLFDDQLPLIVLGLSEGPDVLAHAYDLLHSESLCPCGASIPAFDNLLERAAWTLDLDERDALLYQIGDLVAADPIGFVWRQQSLHAEQQWVHGLEYDPFYRFGQIPAFDLRGVWKETPE